MKNISLITAFLLILALSACSFDAPKPDSEPVAVPEATSPALIYPIDNFLDRITLKPFGIYITKQNSPVQPEKFTGYHTGADAEIYDTEADQEIDIVAIADGTVVLARGASGYGGVIAIEHIINGVTYTAIYGHLDLFSFTSKVGTKVSVGQKIGVLGQGYTSETDWERKHLHFGLLKGSSVNIQGYVQDKQKLASWIDPVEFFASQID